MQIAINGADRVGKSQQIKLLRFYNGGSLNFTKPLIEYPTRWTILKDHGIAVMYGIVFVAILSHELGRLSVKNYEQIIDTAKKFEKNIKLLKSIQKSLKIEKALDSFSSDKISSNTSLNFVLPVNDGYFIYKNISKENVISALEKFKNIKL